MGKINRGREGYWEWWTCRERGIEGERRETKLEQATNYIISGDTFTDGLINLSLFFN